MYQFPKDLYADIRLEDVYQTAIVYENHNLIQNKTSRETGAFLRIWDGRRWYYSATTDLDHIQQELDALAALATPNPDIGRRPGGPPGWRSTGTGFSGIRTGTCGRCPTRRKVALLQSYLPVVAEVPEITDWKAGYLDTHTEKKFWSSLGAELHFDFQRASVVLGFTISAGSVPYFDRVHTYRPDFSGLTGHEKELAAQVEDCLTYAKMPFP